MLHLDRVLRSNLKLKHLQLLVALDEFRHLGHAAEFLSQTQPAVSKMLSEIERQFELELFVRSTRGTEPTAYGEAVLRFARSVLADFQRTREELAATAQGAAGRVVVGAMVVAMPGLLGQSIERLKRQSPQTTVCIEEGDLSRLLPRLRVGELDLIVGRLEPGHAAPDLVTEAWYDERMSLVVRPGHPLTQRSRLNWADLSESPWVMPPAWAATRTKLLQIFHRHRASLPTDLMESASFLATLLAVQQRGAIGFWAESVAQAASAQGLVVCLPLTVPMDLPPVGLITLRARLPTPAADQLIACLRACVPTRSARRLSRSKR
jgi:DNA-binding transcriptional LysR family regulator